jgi:hypothetical protein
MNSTTHNERPEAAFEIAQAIQAITTTKHHEPEVEIRVLTTMQEYRYRHTCPKCGCHTATTLWTQPDPYEAQARICLQCQNVYENQQGQGV